MHNVFPFHQLDFANFASQPIIMERVEWESVVFFGMNENVGEGRGEKEERAEGWWWWWSWGLVWCSGGVVLCCGGAFVCCATNFYQGCVHIPYSFYWVIPHTQHTTNRHTDTHNRHTPDTQQTHTTKHSFTMQGSFLMGSLAL